MKITRIRLSSLRNEEWFSFFTEFKGFVEKSTAAALNIEEMIKAQMLVNGETTYLPFVKSLNTNVDRYNLLLAQRQGKSAAKRNGREEKGE